MSGEKGRIFPRKTKISKSFDLHVNMRTQSEKAFLAKVATLRKTFEDANESQRQIYVLNIKSDAASIPKAIKNRVFPSDDYPSLVERPRGFVYVGLTGLAVEERFEVHRSKSSKAAKIAKLGCLSEGSYEKVGKPLTDKFGFRGVGWRDKKPEKLESWVAWNFYKMGYWVWGSHYHEEEDFLGTPPFD